MHFNFKRFCQSAVVLLIAILFHQTLTAQDLQTNNELQYHVAKMCKTKCADPQLLLMAVQQSAIDHNVPEALILAIIQVESGFKPKAKNSGSVGLMQVNLKYHRNKFKVSPYDIFSNVDVGTGIYKACLKAKRGNVAKALRCYNGEGVKNMIYPNKVLRTVSQIKSLSFS